MSITNRIENIIIALIVAAASMALTIGIMEVTVVKPLKKEMTRQEAKYDQRSEKQTAVIVELAKIEKFKIENNFDKIKAKEGQVVLSLDNKLTTLQLDSIKTVVPEVEKVKKKWWKVW